MTFDMLKTKVANPPILQFLNWGKKFHSLVNAYLNASGNILAKPRDENIYYPIYFANKKSSVKQNYTIPKHKELSMVHSIMKFFHYILANHFHFYVDITSYCI